MATFAKEVDFLHMLKEQAHPPKEREEKFVSRLDKYWLRETEFKDQLRIWRKGVSDDNPNNKKDLLTYLKSVRQEKIDQAKEGIEKYGAMKTTWGVLVRFKRERDGEIQRIKHWFHEKEPHIFTKENEHEIGGEYDKFVDNIMGQVKAWNSKT